MIKISAFTLIFQYMFFLNVPVVDPSERLIGKRRYVSAGQKTSEPSQKKFKHPPYFVPELAHIVALCDERLPYALMMSEVIWKFDINSKIFWQAREI